MSRAKTDVTEALVAKMRALRDEDRELHSAVMACVRYVAKREEVRK